MSSEDEPPIARMRVFIGAKREPGARRVFARLEEHIGYDEHLEHVAPTDVVVRLPAPTRCSRPRVSR